MGGSPLQHRGEAIRTKTKLIMDCTTSVRNPETHSQKYNQQRQSSESDATQGVDTLQIAKQLAYFVVYINHAHLSHGNLARYTPTRRPSKTIGATRGGIFFLPCPPNLRCAPNSGGTAGAYHSGKTDIVNKQGTVVLNKFVIKPI